MTFEMKQMQMLASSQEELNDLAFHACGMPLERAFDLGYQVQSWTVVDESGSEVTAKTVYAIVWGG